MREAHVSFPKIGALLQQRGLQLADMAQDARQTCEIRSMVQPAVRRPGSSCVGREGLSRLPDVLEQKIATHQYHKAAVSACDSGNPSQGFTIYKLAVMLYYTSAAQRTRRDQDGCPSNAFSENRNSSALVGNVSHVLAGDTAVPAACMEQIPLQLAARFGQARW